MCTIYPHSRYTYRKIGKENVDTEKEKQPEKIQLLMDELFTQKKKELTVQSPLAGSYTNKKYQ